MENKFTDLMCYKVQKANDVMPDSWEAIIYAGDLSNYGNPLARVFMGDAGAIHCDKESVEANARLFVNAPLLLEALIFVRESLQFKRMDWKLKVTIDAAIAKSIIKQ